MKTQLPMRTEERNPTEEEHRVIKFRPRTVAKAPQRDGVNDQRSQVRYQPPSNDLSRYEQDRQPADDFHHRMLANTAALAFTVALIAIGLWLAVSIADMRKTQDCVLMGRRDCARISTPHG